MCLYLNPLEYLVLVFFADASMVSMYYVAYAVKEIAKRNEFYDFIVFILFQIAIGVGMLYTRYCLHKEIVAENKQHKEIEQLSRAQNSFFSNMSHEKTSVKRLWRMPRTSSRPARCCST